ncbi:MAG: NADH dehydrogenase subunit [Haloarcula sp.]
MSISLKRLGQAQPSELATTIRNSGIAGAGGAGFPAHAKWERIDEVPYLLMNHQESEPNYYIDKWLGTNKTDVYAEFFDELLADLLDLIVVGAKAKDRDNWMTSFEDATDGTVYLPEDLPLDPTEESGVVFAYTEDKYEFGMESVLLRMVSDIVLRDELPMDHGWIVQNTETMFNIHKTLAEGDSMTHKLVHVDGNVDRHRFLEVPVGTPATDLLAAAGRSPETLSGELLADGGPGWCFEIDESPDTFGVRKRTNCLLVLDEETVEGNMVGDGRINVLNEREWSGDHETEPTTLEPDQVRIPLRTNPNFDGVVARSKPIVDAGDTVKTGELIAVPAGEAISNCQHASIDGTVTQITDTAIEITRESQTATASGQPVGDHHRVHWTFCSECGDYVARPELEHLGPTTEYVCADCR